MRCCCLKLLRINHCDMDSGGINIGVHILICKMVCCVVLYKLKTLKISGERYCCVQLYDFKYDRVWNLVFCIFYIKGSIGGGSAGMST